MQTVTQFLSSALTVGISCSVREILEIETFKSDDLFAAIDSLREFCVEHNLRCVPPIVEGELDDTRRFSHQRPPDVFESELELCLSKGEGHRVEFKQTLCLDTKRHQNDRTATPDQLMSKEVEHEVVKTIAGFLNADGGTLLLGVCDDHSLYGINKEFSFLPGSKRDADGWGLRLSSVLESSILQFRELAGFLQWEIVKKDECAICIIIVAPRRDRLVACRSSDGKDEIAYVRTGNSTTKLSPHAIESLVKSRI